MSLGTSVIIATTIRIGRQGKWDWIPNSGNEISRLQSMDAFPRSKVAEECS